MDVEQTPASGGHNPPDLTPRQSQIVGIARTSGIVNVDSLAEQFLVTPQTIRRDLNFLCANHYLRRTHGGAVFNDVDANLGYQARRHIATTAKRRIGELAANLIPEGSSLFINIGTTTEQVAEHLKNKRDLMVITNNVNVVTTLMGSTGIEIIVAGGMVRHEDSGIVGERASDFLSQFRVDYAIIGTSAIEEDGTLCDYDYREVLAARAIIEHAHSVILVADATKFERSAPIRIADISKIQHFVTDRRPPAAFAEACVAGNVSIHTVSSR
ncbi:MAG: DeoR/GlpR family DNA-binding transcription regulator [Halofilum sp. (in: g-proteobacteria)]|nr:DeoR/GlpR family DNA-binding transcription regulator [Halofilum sp. (in: g-proteobacteria)]